MGNRSVDPVCGGHTHDRIEIHVVNTAAIRSQGQLGRQRRRRWPESGFASFAAINPRWDYQMAGQNRCMSAMTRLINETNTDMSLR